MVGRPHYSVKDLARICRKQTRKAIRVLVQSLKSPDERIRLLAVSMLLDRGYGKPKEGEALEPKDLAGSTRILVVIEDQANGTKEIINANFHNPQGHVPTDVSLLDG